MKIGVIFPQTEIEAHPAAIRDYAQTVEGLGYDYFELYDHVLGANPERPGGWNGPYTHREAFHEPFVLFGYLAALTRRLEFVTGILILPQRQTALVAKQAAQVSLLAGGRLRLGVGIGWNAVEYEALGEDFQVRGKRIEEQVQLLRALWSQPLVTFEGTFDRIPDAGINPLPPVPIPVWFGGDADVVLRRAARLGDGWIPNTKPYATLKAQVEQLHGYLRTEGRDPAGFGLDIRIHANRTPQSSWAAEAAGFAALGATHVCINTMGAGFTTLDQHLDALRRFKAEVS
jgi:probable F420-dependent oxidoreductase